MGQFVRRQGNPRLLAGKAFTDGKIDISISDPDVHWDGQTYQLYYAAGHATAFSDPSHAGRRRPVLPIRAKEAS